jgi:hypothetical protein
VLPLQACISLRTDQPPNQPTNQQRKPPNNYATAANSSLSTALFASHCCKTWLRRAIHRHWQHLYHRAINPLSLAQSSHHNHHQPMHCNSPPPLPLPAAAPPPTSFYYIWSINHLVPTHALASLARPTPLPRAQPVARCRALPPPRRPSIPISVGCSGWSSKSVLKLHACSSRPRRNATRSTTNSSCSTTFGLCSNRHKPSCSSCGANLCRSVW